MNNVKYKISWVHLTSRLKQLAVAVLSVTFGISMYIFMNSFMDGVNGAQTEITFTTMAHIRVYNDLTGNATTILRQPQSADTLLWVDNSKNISYSEGIKNAQDVVNALKADRDVMAVTEQVNQNVFFRNGVTKVNGTLSGIDVQHENLLFNTATYVKQGSLDNLDKRPDGIILGSGLADKTSSKPGDNITLTTSDGVTKIFSVVGILETGSGSIDKSKALISVRTARQLLNKNRNYATDVLATVNDYNNAKEIAGRVRGSIPFKTEAWQEGNSQLESANTLRDIIAVAVSLTILVVAGFGIYNIMNMTVNEKIREIAILKAMGFDGKDIIQIFLAQSLIIGLMGGALGLLLGYAIASVVDRIPFRIASFTSLPISYNASDYILAMLFGLVVTFVAGYLPARKASRIDPVEILRG